MATAKLPAGDVGLLLWADRFSEQISADPGAVGLSPSQASGFEALRLDYAAGLAACDPNNRSKALVVAKNTARAALKKSARLLASIIQGQANVTDAQKTTLGLTVRARGTLTPPPAEAPPLSVESVRGVTARIKVVGRRGKAPGADGIALFSCIGDEPAGNRSDWSLVRLSTRLTLDVTFPPGTAPGTRVWFAAQWFNSRKQMGPASTPIGVHLPGGGVTMTTALARAA